MTLNRLIAAVGASAVLGAGALASAQTPSGRLVGQIVHPQRGPVAGLRLTLQVAGFAAPAQTMTAPDGSFQFILPAAAFGRTGLLASAVHTVAGAQMRVDRPLVIPPVSRGIASLGRIVEISATPRVMSREELSQLQRPPSAAIGIYTQPPANGGRIPDAAIGSRSNTPAPGGIDLENCDARCRARYFEMEDRNARRDEEIVKQRFREMAHNDPLRQVDGYSDRSIELWTDGVFANDGGRTMREARAQASADLARNAASIAIRNHAQWKGACKVTPNGGCISYDRRYVYYTGEFIIRPNEKLPFGRYQLDKQTGRWYAFTGVRWLTLEEQALQMGIVVNLMKTQMHQYLLRMQAITEQQMLNW